MAGIAGFWLRQSVVARGETDNPPCGRSSLLARPYDPRISHRGSFPKKAPRTIGAGAFLYKGYEKDVFVLCNKVLNSNRVMFEN